MLKKSARWRRRDFLKGAGLAAGGVAAGLLESGCASTRSRIVATSSPLKPTSLRLYCPDEKAIESAPVRWALRELGTALAQHQAAFAQSEGTSIAPGNRVMIGPPVAGPEGKGLLQTAGVSLPGKSESLALLSIPSQGMGTRTLLACGADSRGLMYALLELADRVTASPDLEPALDLPKPLTEQPANAIRSINRAFVSDVEDKGWFNDRAFWKEYLGFLAHQRFNRFALTFGIGYDFTRQIRDCYFHFAYPFLVQVPGYSVRARPLPDREREKNLELLRFISDTAGGVGLHFQLGLWTHAYQWTDSPQANYVIDWLTPEKHAAYCRDALKLVLQSCPAIQGVTIRIHGESGVAEGSYSFWETVFAGVAGCGRTVEIDMHAKGIDQKMIDLALATGMPVNVSPKFWAEHMGLPYHQAAIRSLEMPPREAADKGFFAMSSGSRRFLRYGYGDLLAENRRHGVLHRIWPGTQRLLAWGDPGMAAGYGRASSFCGSKGVEICEPLFFKGRKGSGLPGGRDAYRSLTLKPDADWKKYQYTYLLWGRLLYNPEASPETWRRWLRKNIGPAEAIEHDLGHASRILPLLTTAHDPSAANNNFWPEMYWNMSILDAKKRHPYFDSPSPKRFGTVSPLDPELFSSIDEYADELLHESLSGKYSPAQVAQQLEYLSGKAIYYITRAFFAVRKENKPALDRLIQDAFFQSRLGLFFAQKLRAGIFYSLFERTNYPKMLVKSLDHYQAARRAWESLAERAKDIYVSDVTFGPEYFQRGHWSDRLPAIDEDIAAMTAKLEEAKKAPSTLTPEQQAKIVGAMQAATQTAKPVTGACEHAPPQKFQPGEAVPIEVGFLSIFSSGLSVELRYRRVNQAETWRSLPMEQDGKSWQAIIPGDYTNSPFPLQYYFRIRDAQNRAGLLPGLGDTWCNQPYYVIRQAGSSRWLR